MRYALVLEGLQICPSALCIGPLALFQHFQLDVGGFLCLLEPHGELLFMGQLGQHCLKRPLHIDQHLRLKQRLLPDLPDQFQVGFEPLLTDSLVYLALSQVGPGTFSLGTRHTQL